MATFEEVEVGHDAQARRGACTRAARAVAEGHLLAHPTGTVYGLGGLPDSPTDARIGALKGRSVGGVPLLRLALDVDALRRELPGLEWDDRAERLASAFWPGPLTIVFADGTDSGTAVRVEGHPVVRDVLAELGGLLSSTSLNAAGRAPADTVGMARSVLRQLPEDRRAIVLLAAGDLPGPPPSTLVSLLTSPARVLRAGAVEAAAVLECLGEAR